jgi:hypothetical protein
MSSLLTTRTTIVFHLQHLTERGTTVATCDYAYYNIKLLSNRSIIVYPKEHRNENRNFVLEGIREQFKEFIEDEEYSIQGFDSYTELEEEILPSLHADGIFTICSNGVQCFHSKKIPNLIMGCLRSQPLEAKAERYATNSYATFVYQKNSPNHIGEPLLNSPTSVVPHIVEAAPNAPTTASLSLRTKYQIPSTAFVIGRHGGTSNFYRKVHPWIEASLSRWNDGSLYYIFMNTDHFFDSPYIIYLEGTSSKEKKQQFISECDAMIHASWQGESFGISVGEFNIQGKPILTMPAESFQECVNNFHLDILLDDEEIAKPNYIFHNHDFLHSYKHDHYKTKIMSKPNQSSVFLYTSLEELMESISTSMHQKEKAIIMKKTIGYSKYSPENVMKIFHEVYLSHLKESKMYGPIQLSIFDNKKLSQMNLKIPRFLSFHHYQNDAAFIQNFKWDVLLILNQIHLFATGAAAVAADTSTSTTAADTSTTAATTSTTSTTSTADTTIATTTATTANTAATTAATANTTNTATTDDTITTSTTTTNTATTAADTATATANTTTTAGTTNTNTTITNTAAADTTNTTATTSTTTAADDTTNTTITNTAAITIVEIGSNCFGFFTCQLLSTMKFRKYDYVIIEPNGVYRSLIRRNIIENGLEYSTKNPIQFFSTKEEFKMNMTAEKNKEMTKQFIIAVYKPNNQNPNENLFLHLHDFCTF